MASHSDTALLDYVIEVSRKMAEIRLLTLLLDYVMAEVLSLVGAERGYVVLLEADGRLDFRVTRGQDNASLGDVSDQISHSILNEVVNQGEALVLINALTDPRFCQAQSVVGMRLRSVMCVPLITQQRTIGAIYVENRSVSGRFQPADANPLQLFANQAAVAIDNARLYQQAQQEIAERKRTEAAMTELINQLETQRAELERFTYTVSHDLKSPLITIQGFTGLVEQSARQGELEQLLADLEQIRRATDQMKQLLDDLLELSRIGRLVNPPEYISMNQLVNEALFLVSDLFAERGVQVTIMPDMPTVYGDRLRLLEMLQNLLDNAAKFMGDQPQPQVTIGEDELGEDGDNQHTVFFIRDNGMGIEPRYHDKVFGLFDRLDQSQQGTGIGLALTKRIIEVHGGRIWLNSAGRGQGTTFYFTLPAAPPAP